MIVLLLQLVVMEKTMKQVMNYYQLTM